MAGHASLQVNANTSYASMLPGVNYPVQGNMESDGEDEFHDANEEESVDDSTDEEESGDDSTAEDYWDSDMVRGCLDTDLSKIKRSGKFYAWFKPSPGASNPGLEIEGLRRFGMPLQEHDIKDMIAESHRAPYGKGTETIVNEAVRKTWEIDGNRVKLRHPAWPEEFNKIVSTACGQLGVVGGVDAVEAQLYKLLIYEEGAMFKPHKDSEKAPRMFGTLVVCLPSVHMGGELIVSFNGERQVLATAVHSEWMSTCMAWYADVVHSVEPVTSGHRVVLTYNLVAKGLQPPPSLQDLQVHVDQVRHTLKRWDRTGSPEFLVYKLEHNYTNASIRAADLKGTDIHRVRCLMHLQKELGLRLLLGSLEKSVSGSCEPNYRSYSGGYRSWRRNYYYDESEEEDEGPHHIDEETESSLTLVSVVDLQGNVVARNVGVDEDEHIVQRGYLGDRKPDDEDYEGHTGNAGAQATHWYRALIILPKENWIDFILNSAAYANRTDFRPLLTSQLNKLGSNPADEQARENCSKICHIVIGKHATRGNLDQDELRAVFDACITLGRKDLAESIIPRYYPRAGFADLSHAVETCHLSGWDDLAASVVKTYKCMSSRDFVEVVDLCNRLQRKDLLESLVVASSCHDESTFRSSTAAWKCEDLTWPPELYKNSEIPLKKHPAYYLAHRNQCSPADFRKIVLPLVIAQSALYPFNDLRGCLETIFEGYESITDCELALKQLTDGWKYHDLQDGSNMATWKRFRRERTLQSTSALNQHDVETVKQIIREQRSLIGEQETSWVVDSLLPIAIKKAAAGEIAFALILHRVLAPPSMPPPLFAQASSTLAASIIPAISLSKPFKLSHTNVTLSSRQETTEHTVSDLVSFGELLGSNGISRHLGYAYEAKLLLECKTAGRNHRSQIEDLLREIFRRSGPGYSAWFVDMLQAYTLRIVGPEPEMPRNWTMPRRRGCGCLDCNLLDRFLLDPVQKSIRFPRAQMTRTHLQSRLLRHAHSPLYDESFELSTIARGSPHTLVIDKRHAHYDAQHATWHQASALTTNFIRTLIAGSGNKLRTVLGPSYDDLVNLRTVTLQCTDSGATTSGYFQASCKWLFEDNLQVSDTPTAATTTTGEATPTHAGLPTSTSVNGTKRPAPESPASGERASKRQVEIIDLSDEL